MHLEFLCKLREGFRDWLRGASPTREQNARDRFQESVLACTRALCLILPWLSRRHSREALSVALGIQLQSLLRHLLREGRLKKEQAQLLVGSILDDEPSEDDAKAGD
jgi:hypothetical protein